MGFSSIDANSGGIRKCWSFWSRVWVLNLFIKFCVICSLLLAAILCLVLLLKAPLLPIVRFCCPLIVSTLFCMLAFLRFWRRSQKVKDGEEVLKKSEDEFCQNAISLVEQSSKALKHQGSGVETQYCRQASESRPESWLAYVRGSETDRDSIWYLEKAPRAEFSFEGMGTVTVEEDFMFNESWKTTEEDNVAVMRNLGNSMRKVFVKLQSDGKLEEEMVKSAQADAKPNDMPEQESVNSARMVSDITGSNFSFSRRVKSLDESHSEDSDAGSSAWEQTIDSSENGSSSSTWHRGSDNSDIRAAALDKESSIWKMGTILSDQESAAPEMSFRSIKNKPYTRLIYSSGWESDESFDPYVKLFAEDESVSDAEGESASYVADSSSFARQEPNDNSLRQRSSTFHQNFLGARAASSKGMNNSKRKSLGNICRAFRDFLRRISGQKMRFFRK